MKDDKVSISVIRERKYSQLLKKQVTYVTLLIGNNRYDLNCFTDSGSWIKDMRISKDGSKLTIFVDFFWFLHNTGNKNHPGIFQSIFQAMEENNVINPFTEIVFKDKK